MSLKIFVIEDDATYSQLLSFRLKQSGYTDITVFDSGEESLENISEKPDLVLLDFSLKGLNGLDTLNHIKKKSPGSDVIVLTGLENEKVAIKCKEAGALDFLQKEEESLVTILDYAKKSETKKGSKKRTTLIIAVAIIIVLIAILLSQTL